MKELYMTPELNVICFAPVERLALELDESIQNPDLEPPVVSEEGDLDLDLF